MIANPEECAVSRRIKFPALEGSLEDYHLRVAPSAVLTEAAGDHHETKGGRPPVAAGAGMERAATT